MFPGRISRNIGENIFRPYTGTTSENTEVNSACLTTRWKYDVIYLTFLALDVILQCVAMQKGFFFFPGCATCENITDGDHSME